MSETKRIVVGSKNPVKIQSALAGFEQMFPGIEFIVHGISVPSEVSDQPMSNEETLRGATNRAWALREEAIDGDFFVGIEGGIEAIDQTFFANAWIVIIDAEGRMARGRSGSFSLPPKVKELVKSGIELGFANDEVFGERNSKQSGGAVGSLTGGVISRQSLYEHAMVLTLIAYRNEKLFYEPDDTVIQTSDSVSK